MKMSTVAQYAILSFVVFIIIVIFGGMIFTPSFPDEFTFNEEPLVKNTKLQIRPSELYSYVYTVNGTNNTLSFRTGQAPDCVFIQVVEAVNRTGTCVDADGNDRLGSNATLAVPFITFFKPWMLAVRDGWEWGVNMTINATGGELVLKTFKYEVVGAQTIHGRDSFVVRIGSNEVGEEIVTTWVDKEKRVMLREEGPNYNVTLVRSPFFNASG